MKHFIILAALCVSCKVYAGKAWQLKKEQDGIKVYTAVMPENSIRAIKVECTINTTLSRLTALLLDAEAHERWVYSTKRSYSLKQSAPGHQIYYSEMTMPWPMSNREVVMELKISQQPETKVLTVEVEAIKGLVAAGSNKVRVVVSEVKWTVTPVDKDQLKIEYIAQVDPGGSVPSWVVNMFITKGPFETFKQLRKTVSLPEYQDASFDFITD